MAKSKKSRAKSLKVKCDYVLDSGSWIPFEFAYIHSCVCVLMSYRPNCQKVNLGSNLFFFNIFHLNYVAEAAALTHETNTEIHCKCRATSLSVCTSVCASVCASVRVCLCTRFSQHLFFI